MALAVESEAGPSISVVIPMYNAEKLIERCLAPLLSMLARSEIVQIIVVNDGSTDRSAQIVQRHAAVQLIAMDAQGGPGAARNLGARLATGTHLWFVDSDVIVADDGARILREALTTTGAAAVIGSYDDKPAAQNFLSQYKNLVHHYYHHRGKEGASTFWAGCGAVERELFLRIGGFDAKQFRYPSIEDIDLGYRIGDGGGRIVLERRFQGTHLKKWRFVNLVHTEIFRRALPWSRLMLKRRNITDDLNVGKGERARAVLALANMAAVPAWAIGWLDGGLLAVLIAVLLAANGSFIVFFARTRGPLFALRAFLFHQLYYAYSSAAFAAAMVEDTLKRLQQRRDRVTKRLAG